MPTVESYLQAAAIRDRRAKRKRRPRRARVYFAPGIGWVAELSTGLSTYSEDSQLEAIAALVRLIEYRESVVEK